MRYADTTRQAPPPSNGASGAFRFLELAIRIEKSGVYRLYLAKSGGPVAQLVRAPSLYLGGLMVRVHPGPHGAISSVG